jgi:murein DD-endopeptidase MepM/ murein hydrolase activator NlpD
VPKGVTSDPPATSAPYIPVLRTWVTPQVPVLRKYPLPHGLERQARSTGGQIRARRAAATTQTERMLPSPVATIGVTVLLVASSIWMPNGAVNARTANNTAIGVSETGPVTVSAANAATVGTWDWPLAAPHTLLRPYLAPATPYSAGHRGIDIEAHGNEKMLLTAVTAPAAGTVHFAGFVVDRPVLSVRHPGGVISSFEPVTTTLVIGDAVRAGQQIGTLEAGHCSAPCLHFGVRIDGGYVSPLLFLGGVPRAVLLPTRFPT